MRSLRTSIGVRKGLSEWLCLLFAFLTGLLSAGEESSLRVAGWLGASVSKGSGPESWLSGGYGKLAASEASTYAAGEFHLGLDWEPSTYFSLHFHGLAQVEEGGERLERAGFTEFFLNGNLALSEKSALRLRLGQFFPPTSMENTEFLWQTRGTVQFSALNSWIGEELRSQGLDGMLSRELGGDVRAFAALSGLVGNDTTGALLAWRGWAIGNRLTNFQELLPLPPLASLGEDGAFVSQRDDGTRPFGRDLDGRMGWSARAGIEWIERFSLLLGHCDNRADRGLHRGEYAWHTRFDQAGLAYEGNGRWSVAAEWMAGETGMGSRSSPRFVDASFRAWYLLNRWEWRRQSGSWLLSQRFERFSTRDLDEFRSEINADWNQEEGESWSLSLAWEGGTSWQVILEWLDLDQERSFFEADHAPARLDGSSWTLQFKKAF